MSFFIAFSLRQGSLNWKLTFYARLPGQRALGIHLSSSPNAKDRGIQSCQLFTLVLQIQSRVLMLVNQTLLLNKLSPQLPGKLIQYLRQKFRVV